MEPTTENIEEPAKETTEPEKETTEVAQTSAPAVDTDEEPEAPKVHSYIVSTRTDREVIEGREIAVNKAKAMTADGTSVQVEREDGRVRMQFRDGSLVEYVYETRKGRTV